MQLWKISIQDNTYNLCSDAYEHFEVLDDQEIVLSSNKEGTLVAVTPKKERKVGFQ